MTPESTIASWLQGPYDEETKEEIRRLQNSDPTTLIDSFRGDLSFGTGGIRALMGVGSNRLNVYTIRQITRGVAAYFKEGPICIGYDVRKNSLLFAQEAARVLAGQKIPVYLFQDVAPTPLVSFACRHLQCRAAIVITASHNPSAYNGYKVYGKEGSQLVSPEDKALLQAVETWRHEMAPLAPLDSPLIQSLGEEIDEHYLSSLQKLSLHPPQPLRIVYSNLHGTGLRLVPKALERCGYQEVSLVEEQKPYDGLFSQALSPNPEEKKALELGSEQLLRERADLFLATDPDADRVGAVIRVEDKAVRLTGHQMAALCLDHILSSLQKTGRMPPHPACIKTVVTTELFQRVAESYHCTCVNVLTGFKYIAEKISQWEKEGTQFLFGAEESYGYLFGTHVRDKDAIGMCTLIAEMASSAKAEGKTLLDRLYALYATHGVHREKLIDRSWPSGSVSMEAMQKQMGQLRANPPQKIGDKKVVSCTDYKKEGTGLPLTDMLLFQLEGGSRVIIRPSGTEPKIKIYLEVVDGTTGALSEAIDRADKELEILSEAIDFLRN